MNTMDEDYYSNLIKADDTTSTKSIHEQICEALLEDPDNETKRLAEDYLLQCLLDSVEDPEKSPVLYRFFKEWDDRNYKLEVEIGHLKLEIERLKNEISNLFYNMIQN